MKQKVTLQLILHGADCASCAIGLERVVRDIPGVTSATVNPIAETITGEYDPSTRSGQVARANPEMFADRIHKTYGFDAKVVDEQAEGHDHERMLRAEELQKLRRKVFVVVERIVCHSSLLAVLDETQVAQHAQLM